MSNAARAQLTMDVGAWHAGETWTEIYGKYGGTVQIDSMGFGIFGVAKRSVSVWVRKLSDGETFRPFLLSHI